MLGVQFNSANTTVLAAVRVRPWEHAVMLKMATLIYWSYWNFWTLSFLFSAFTFPSILIYPVFLFFMWFSYASKTEEWWANKRNLASPSIKVSINSIEPYIFDSPVSLYATENESCCSSLTLFWSSTYSSMYSSKLLDAVYFFAP